MTPAADDQRLAAQAHARAVVATIADALPDGVAFPASTRQHQALVSMVVGRPERVRSCAHLAHDVGWQPVVAFGWEPDAVRCLLCAFVSLPTTTSHCVCGQPQPGHRVVVSSGTVVLVADLCHECHAALSGEDDSP